MPSATDTITIRPFEEGDFEQVTSLMPPEWRFKGCTPEEEYAQSHMDFAGMLMNCNVRLVAELCDEHGSKSIVGLLFAHLSDLPMPEDTPLWQHHWDAGLNKLAQGGEAALRALTYIQQLNERGDLIIADAGNKRGQDNELELFVVKPEARGKGVGNALVTTFEQLLIDLGVQSYWLQTDSACSWQWYEHHGYTRVSDIKLDPDVYIMPDAMKDASSDATDGSESGLHTYMYRKTLSLIS